MIFINIIIIPLLVELLKHTKLNYYSLLKRFFFLFICANQEKSSKIEVLVNEVNFPSNNHKLKLLKNKLLSNTEDTSKYFKIKNQFKRYFTQFGYHIP